MSDTSTRSTIRGLARKFFYNVCFPFQDRTTWNRRCCALVFRFFIPNIGDFCGLFIFLFFKYRVLVRGAEIVRGDGVDKLPDDRVFVLCLNYQNSQAQPFLSWSINSYLSLPRIQIQTVHSTHHKTNLSGAEEVSTCAYHHWNLTFPLRECEFTDAVL